MPGKYDDYDFEELPPEVQQAAKDLGYTEKMWDKDKEPKSASKDWDELTEKEKAAAKVFGYDQAKWDAED